jgi:hypothetical protein
MHQELAVFFLQVYILKIVDFSYSYKKSRLE